MNMISFQKILLISLLLYGGTSFGEVGYVANTKSPNQQICIARENDAEGSEGYFFVNTKNNLKRGVLLSPTEAAGLRNIVIRAVWNGDSSRVAILLSYGTKLSTLEIFEEGQDGQFKSVPFSMPDPIEVYQKEYSAKLNLDGVTGFSVNRLGSWIKSNVVSLMVGDAKEFDDQIIYILATFHVRIEGGHSLVENVQSAGKLTKPESDAFLKKWTKREK